MTLPIVIYKLKAIKKTSSLFYSPITKNGSKNPDGLHIFDKSLFFKVLSQNIYGVSIYPQLPCSSRVNRHLSKYFAPFVDGVTLIVMRKSL